MSAALYSADLKSSIRKVVALLLCLTLIVYEGSIFSNATVTPLKPSDEKSSLKNVKQLVTKTSKPISKFIMNADDINTYFENAELHPLITTFSALTIKVDRQITQLSKQTGVQEFSIYAKDLESNVVYSWNSNRLAKTQTFGHAEAYYKGASVAKLYEVFAVYKLAEAGFLDLDQPIKDYYTGYKFTLRQAIAKAIRKSDNDSFCRILRAVGPENINTVLKQFGIQNNYIYAELGPAKGFSVPNNRIRYKTEKSSRVNPYGAGLILESVYKEAAKGNPYMKDFKNHLLNNVYTSRIPAALSYKIAVAHKTGTIEKEGVYHDAGIVYGSHPYIIVVYTKGAPNVIKAHIFIKGAVRSINKAFRTNRVQMDSLYSKQQKKALTNMDPPITEASSQ